MFEQISSYQPEQVFLFQGDEAYFDQIIKGSASKIEIKKLSRFTVEDAKDAVDFNLERPSQSFYLIYFDIFVRDAAEILLKTLEEPKQGIYIVFVTPHPYLLPQTIKSRARIVNNESLNIEIPKYLNSKKEVLEYIKVFGDEDIEASTRRALATNFLDTLEKHFRNDLKKIGYIYKGKEMIFKANMPTKQVVEYVVIMVY